MNPLYIIARKRDGHELTRREIEEFIGGFTRGEVPDYQMAALAMAICCRGMTAGETAVLTEVMLRSGVSLSWPDDGRPRVDKHSTGGIGDKVSLVLAPLLACCEVVVPMISGRGLGATGGTLDKLESIPGLRTQLGREELQRIANAVGCVICGTGPEVAPADQKLYALRDATATVPSRPLITASIMSKKLAEGLDALVLDVKYGSGAFMKSQDRATGLAQAMVEVGRLMGVPTSAVLTDMGQPLGRAIGNAVEVQEAVSALRGGGPADLMEVTLMLGAELLVACGRAASPHEARRVQQSHIDSGRACEKFREMIAAQGGDPGAALTIAPRRDWTAGRNGFVEIVNAEQFGWAVISLGGGRMIQGAAIDHSVGLECLVRTGERVAAGQPLVGVFADERGFARVEPLLGEAVRIVDCAPEPVTATRGSPTERTGIP
jgi:pyrimidine-nucleoside phosphorylase